MRLLEQILATSALVSLITAAPTHEKRATSITGKKQFKIPQGQPKHLGKKIAGPIALAQVYGKYAKIGASAPADVDAAASRAADAGDGTVAANPEQFDQAYLSPVSVGGQTLNLDFDTGSSDLWVFSSKLPTAQQNGHDIYDPASSPTAKELTGETWSIRYGDGSSASGTVYTDVVNVGGTSVANQAVEVADTISSSFAEDLSDGLLGLAFSSINTVTPDQQKTFFANAEGTLDAPLFTANLKKGVPGSYDFGYIDDSEHTGDITYTPVDNSQGFWGFTSSGFTVGSGAAVSENIPAIADTGTSLLLVPDDVTAAYYAQVDGATNDQQAGGYTFPCSTTLPDISFAIEGYNAVVPGSFVNYAPVSDGSSTCFGGIQSSAGVGVNIFGDVFLKAQFVVFEDAAGGPRLGFAAKDL